MKNYLHLILFSIVYTVLVAICWIAPLDPFLGRFVGVTELAALSIGLATGMLVASWSVFGPGPSWSRFALSHAVGAPVILANAVGFWAQMVDIPGSLTLWVSIKVGLLIAIVLTAAIQIPYWFIRFVVGWKFGFEEDKPTSSISIREMFLVTFVFGLAFASPQIADRILLKDQLNQIKIGAQFMDMEQIDERSWSGSSVVVSEQNIERLRSQVQKLKFYRMSRTIYSFAGVLSVVSLILSPLILIVLRVKRWFVAVSFTVLFGLIAFAITLVPVFLTTPTGIRDLSELAWRHGLIIGTVVLAFTLPLLFSRNRGVVLHSNRTERSKKNVRVASQA